MCVLLIFNVKIHFKNYFCIEKIIVLNGINNKIIKFIGLLFEFNIVHYNSNY